MSKAAKERKAIKPQSSNVFKHETKIEMKDEDESMETACFNWNDEVVDYAGEHCNIKNGLRGDFLVCYVARAQN